MNDQLDLKKLSMAKLEKEALFAGPANDGSLACLAWNAAIIAEYERRGKVPPIELSVNWSIRPIHVSENG